VTQFHGASIVGLRSPIPQKLYIVVMYLILFIVTYKNVIFKYAYTDHVTIEINPSRFREDATAPDAITCYHQIASHLH